MLLKTENHFMSLDRTTPTIPFVPLPKAKVSQPIRPTQGQGKGIRAARLVQAGDVNGHCTCSSGLHSHCTCSLKSHIIQHLRLMAPSSAMQVKEQQSILYEVRQRGTIQEEKDYTQFKIR